MGDHYCCSKCHQRYDMCTCREETPRINLGMPKIPELYARPPQTFKELQPSLDDIRYFHDKFQKYQDEKSATQLTLAIQAFLELKGK